MTKTVPAVFFSLHTQFQNLGDCVINELLLRELARHSDIEVLAPHAPNWMLKRLGEVPSIQTSASGPGWASKLVRSLCLRRTIFAFKPGHFWISSKPKSLLYSVVLLLFCCGIRMLGGQVIRAGISIEPLDPMQRRLFAWLGKLHSLFGVRDQRSLEYGKSIGIRRVVYSPDMAFLLAKGWPGSHASGQGDGEPRDRLSISFREDAGLAQSAYRTNLCQQIRDYTSTATTRLEPVVAEQVGYDHPLSTHLAQLLDCQHVQFLQDEASAHAVFANYQRSQFVVSNRLHSLLFGWSAGAIPVPLIVASSHSKIGDLFRSLDLQDLILTWNDLEKLPRHLTMIQEQSVQWRLRLTAAMEKECRTLETILQESSAPRA